MSLNRWQTVSLANADDLFRRHFEELFELILHLGRVLWQLPDARTVTYGNHGVRRNAGEPSQLSQDQPTPTGQPLPAIEKELPEI